MIKTALGFQIVESGKIDIEPESVIIELTGDVIRLGPFKYDETLWHYRNSQNRGYSFTER